MPYIKKELRKEWQLASKIGEDFTEGELNYIITCICIDYLNYHKESYKTYNSIIGALESAKLEIYRRRIAPYEDKKCIENGDIPIISLDKE